MDSDDKEEVVLDVCLAVLFVTIAYCVVASIFNL